MSKRFLTTVCMIFIIAIISGVCWNNFVAASIYERGIECIRNSEYDEAAECLKAVNPKLRSSRLEKVLFPKGTHESFYKDSSCLYAYTRALQCFTEGLPEDYVRYYLECIPDDYSGVLAAEIREFIEDFMQNYR